MIYFEFLVGRKNLKKHEVEMKFFLMAVISLLSIFKMSFAEANSCITEVSIPYPHEVIAKYSSNPYGLSPLNYAIDIKDFPAVQSLILGEVGLNSAEILPRYLPQKYKYTPAVRLSMLSNDPIHADIATYLIKLLLPKIDLNYLSGNYGLTQGQELLIDFVNSTRNPHSCSLIRILLDEYKIDPNFAIEANRMQPIQFALQWPNLEAITLLLEYGAATLDNFDCFSKLHCCTDTEKFKKSFIFLISNGANYLRNSDINPNLSGIEFLYDRINSLPDIDDIINFKKETIEFLEFYITPIKLKKDLTKFLIEYYESEDKKKEYPNYITHY